MEEDKPVTNLEIPVSENADEKKSGLTEDAEEGEAIEEKGSLKELEELEDVEKLVVGSPKEASLKKLAEENVQDAQLPIIEDFVWKAEEDAVKEQLLKKEKEEQLLLKEEELKKEEERREKMKVLLTGYLELRTKKEIEKALLNEKKIISQWLQPFRETRQKEWLLELKMLKLAFLKALDYKKSHIHAIQRERKLIELNHLWADSSHYRTLEEINDFMRGRCEKLKLRYLEELEEIKKYYLEKEQEIILKCSKAEERAEALEKFRASVHENVLKQTQDALERYKYQAEFLKGKEIDIILTKHSTYVEKIVHELQTAISPPEHKMDEIRSLFQEWKNKYESFINTFNKNKKEFVTASEEIPDLERKVEAARKRLAELKKESSMAKSIELEEMTRLQNISKKQEKLQPSLRKLISSSEEVMTKLRERKVKLDRIVKLKKLCDHLETESDKAHPSVPLLDTHEQQKLKENDCLPLIKQLCSEDIEDPILLENLYRKVSRVQLQNQVLLRDIEMLKVDGMALRSGMKKYLKSIASGEWARIPDDYLQTLEAEAETSTTAMLPDDKEKQMQEAYVKMNLDLLHKKCRPVNKAIEEQIEEEYK
ncbi:golgin subfamily A member 6-like protein 22 [Stegodyphus dumicola]|uniref:golgin subfamily A member 6-like protein 22 n=1 Tax=Stegodyphus dumicola TaxID=202533 RepID=UPI0015B07FB3|nr:golgin subfamily A member 6-like protein 22 [Stegodyphus dumicola]XP_035214988.1 golgin subfamily A member 6-like protein 22 [Stegodyphus dumicola]